MLKHSTQEGEVTEEVGVVRCDGGLPLSHVGPCGPLLNPSFYSEKATAGFCTKI